MNTLLHRAQRTEFVVTNPSTTAPIRLTYRGVVDMTRSGDGRRVTVECSQHGFNTGDRVYISGALEPEFNTADLTDAHGMAGALIVGVPSYDEFYIMLDGSSSAATHSPAIELYADVWVRQATLIGKSAFRTANVGDVYIGTRYPNNQQPYVITSDSEAFLPAGREAVGPMTNLGDWYLDVANANDGLYVLYF